MILNKTKIIATIGPSSNNAQIINKMIKKGMNVARINMAHQIDKIELENLINTINLVSSGMTRTGGIAITQ